MIELISAGINIIMAAWVLLLMRRNAKLQTEASNARLDAKLAKGVCDELSKFRRAGRL